MKNSKFYSKNIKKETNNSGNISNKTDNLKNIIAPSYMGGVVSRKFVKEKTFKFENILYNEKGLYKSKILNILKFWW